MIKKKMNRGTNVTGIDEASFVFCFFQALIAPLFCIARVCAAL